MNKENEIPTHKTRQSMGSSQDNRQFGGIPGTKLKGSSMTKRSFGRDLSNF